MVLALVVPLALAASQVPQVLPLAQPLAQLLLLLQWHQLPNKQLEPHTPLWEFVARISSAA